MGNHLTANIIKDLPGNLARAVKRRSRRWNAIPRAEKQMDKIQDNPTRAPIHETTQKLVEQLLKENPEKLNELTEKDENLQKHLGSIYVTSEGDNSEIFSKKRLPDSYQYYAMRRIAIDEEVPQGRYNTTRAEHFLAAHERDSKVYSADVLADVYKIDKDAMKNILEYVKVYCVAVPMKKTPAPGAVRKLAQDMMPGGLYEEPEIRVLERKIQLAKNLMAKLYGQQQQEPKKLNYDMNMFESLVALKPVVKKMKDDVVAEYSAKKTVDELGEKLSGQYFHEPESKRDTTDKAEKTKDEFVDQKSKKKLGNFGLFDTYEEDKKRKKAEKLAAELEREYINPNECVSETVITPEMAEENFFAQQTKKKLENIYLLEDKKKVDEKNNVDSVSSSDSPEVNTEKSDGLKAQFKKKISDNV